MLAFDIVNCPERNVWSSFVREHPKGSIFHTPEMMDVFAAARNHSCLVLAAVDPASRVLALLTAVRIQTLPGPLGAFAARSILYAEPLCEDSPRGIHALQALVREHDRWARSRALFIEVRPLCPAGVERHALMSCGYASQEYLNYIGDLRKSVDDLWRGFNRNRRRNIQRSEREGLTVEDMTDCNGVEVLYRFLRTTYERVHIPLAHKSLFQAALATLAPKQMLRIFVAQHQGKPVGASAFLIYKRALFDWYRGTERLKLLAPDDCLLWHSMQWGQRHNCEVLDFGGAGWAHEPYGVRDFKASFGGQLVGYGRYRKICSAWKFRIAETTYEIVRNSVYPILRAASR
jgi:serine/alanine adding enzyme